MTLVYRGRTHDYEWPDDQWPAAVNYALRRAGMVAEPARRYRMCRVATEPRRAKETKWVGLTHDGHRLDLESHTISNFHAQIPSHYKAHKYFNGRSLEVGGARFIRIAAGSAEAHKRGWTDLADVLDALDVHGVES
jgi:hypothetical protein